jgi:hypothetical protein
MKSAPRTMTAGVIAFFFLVSGCVSMERITGYFKKDTYYVHTVRWPGETLSIISKWYTGSGDDWKILAQINSGLDPDRIHIGETIRIPESMMERKTPLPQEFVRSSSPVPQKQAPPVKADSFDRPPELFGPKPYPSQ